MARLNKNSYERMSYDELRPKVYAVVVDMINGFAKEGTLADPAILETAAPIADLLAQTRPETLFLCDCHEPGCIEFESFPVHCLKGSAESEIIEELKDFEGKIIEKNAISAFGTEAMQKWADEVKDGSDVIVTGCCTDLCVLQFVLPLRSWLNEKGKKDVRIIVPADCVETYHIDGVHSAQDWNAFALMNMELNGVKVTAGFDPKGTQQ